MQVYMILHAPKKRIKEECTHLYSIGVFGLHMEGEHNLGVCTMQLTSLILKCHVIYTKGIHLGELLLLIMRFSYEFVSVMIVNGSNLKLNGDEWRPI